MTNDISPQLNFLAENESRFYFSFNLEEQKISGKNPAFDDFFKNELEDYSLDELIEFIHPDDRLFMDEVYKELLSGEIKEGIEFRILVKQRIYFIKMTAIINSNFPRQLIGHACDVSDEKAYIRNLMEYTNKKNAVLNIVSHDLAGPLGSIQMLSGLLKQRSNSISELHTQKIINMIESNCKRGIQMIQEFIKKEFLESAGVEVQMTRYNIVEKIEHLITEYKSSELHLKLTFEFNCIQPEIYVMIDDVKFLQVINNLISNSIKFTPDGGKISINISVNNKKVVIEIADTGIGIPKKFHEKLFDKFNLAGRTGLKGESSVGLGMSIIKTIVEWHKGRLWFNSEENKGTSFFIEIDECS